MSRKEINIGFIDVNEVEIGSTIGIGRNLQMSIHTTLNANQGFGIESSDGSLYNSPISKVWDSDIFDDNSIYRKG